MSFLVLMFCSFLIMRQFWDFVACGAHKHPGRPGCPAPPPAARTNTRGAPAAPRPRPRRAQIPGAPRLPRAPARGAHKHRHRASYALARSSAPCPRPRRAQTPGAPGVLQSVSRDHRVHGMRGSGARTRAAAGLARLPGRVRHTVRIRLFVSHSFVGGFKRIAAPGSPFQRR